MLSPVNQWALDIDRSPGIVGPVVLTVRPPEQIHRYPLSPNSNVIVLDHPLEVFFWLAALRGQVAAIVLDDSYSNLRARTFCQTVGAAYPNVSIITISPEGNDSDSDSPREVRMNDCEELVRV